VLAEPIPAHLLALGRKGDKDEAVVTRQPSAVILPFRQREPKPARPSIRFTGGFSSSAARWSGLTAMAMLCVLVVGFTVVLFSGRIPYDMADPDIQMAQSLGTQPQVVATADPTRADSLHGDTVRADTGTGSAGWIDTIAGYHNLFIASAEAQAPQSMLFDVTPRSENELPGDIQVPNLLHWGLDFQGARRIVLDGKPAFQFFYRPGPPPAAPATSNAAPATTTTLAATAAAFGSAKPTQPTDRRVGAMTLFVTTSDRTADRPELLPAFQRRDNINVTYWRHRGHGYALVGQADKGWMFSVASDIAYQTTPR
jgi:hypothetical protein